MREGGRGRESGREGGRERERRERREEKGREAASNSWGGNSGSSYGHGPGESGPSVTGPLRLYLAAGRRRALLPVGCPPCPVARLRESQASSCKRLSHRTTAQVRGDSELERGAGERSWSVRQALLASCISVLVRVMFCPLCWPAPSSQRRPPSPALEWGPHKPDTRRFPPPCAMLACLHELGHERNELGHEQR